MKTDWHDVSGQTSISSTAIAGATSSIITKTILFPADTLKCRLQSGVSLHVFTPKGIFNGLVPKILLYSPYQAIYMSVYTQTRDRLHSGAPNQGIQLWKFAAAGIAAELAGAGIRVPMEAIKQRMQMGNIGSHRELWSLVTRNPLQFFKMRNFIAQTIVHDIPCGTVHWISYEYLKRSSYSIFSAPTAGAVAGVTTAIVTNPLDVIKTRMITRPNEYKTVSTTVKSIMAEHGYHGFYRGVLPRILHIAPNSALYMWIFDLMFRNIETLRSD